MRTSEVIAKLQTSLDQDGDLDVVLEMSETWAAVFNQYTKGPMTMKRTEYTLTPAIAKQLAQRLVNAADRVAASADDHEYVVVDNDTCILRIAKGLHPNLRDEEYTIARKVIIKAINLGYTISVNDGVEYAILRSSNIEAILAAMGSTDQDILRFHNREGQRTGWVTCIWGNGADVIADYCDVPAMRDLVEGI